MILQYAIANGKNEIIKFLLENGYDVNCSNEFCEVPTIHAIYSEEEDALDILLQYNPDLEKRSIKFNTNALETAVFRNNANIVSKLLKQGTTFSLQSYNNSCNIIFYFSFRKNDRMEKC